MYRDRIAEQMCREPDEELSYVSAVAPGNMSVIIYNLSSGCRLWFNMLPGGEIAVGWGFLQPGEDDGEMFWRKLPGGPEVKHRPASSQGSRGPMPSTTGAPSSLRSQATP